MAPDGGGAISADDDKELERLKTLKVQIPLAYHVRLHSLKVLTGQSISDTVTEAVARYLDEGDQVTDLGELEGGAEHRDRSP